MSYRTDEYQQLVDAGLLSRFDEEQICTFRFSPTSQKDLEVLIGHAGLAQKITSGGYYELLVTSLSENHSEGYGLTNVLADTFVAQATGARPIKIALSGYVYMTPDKDLRTDFVHLYHTALRGTQLSKHRLVLEMFYKETALRFWPMNLAVSVSQAVEDFAQISMQGVGSQYRNLYYPDNRTSA